MRQRKPHCAWTRRAWSSNEWARSAKWQDSAPTRRTSRRPGATQEWHRLSEPERDIARLVGAGLTNRQVAKQLFLSPHTVDYHLRGIFRKLGINSRVELARLAHEQAPTKA